MRVLYLLRYFPALSETFVFNEIAGVIREGIDVTVARLGTRPDGALVTELPEAEILDIPRRPLQGWLASPTAGQRWLQGFQRRKDVARMAWLREQVAGFDRIHVHFAGEAAEVACALHIDLGIPYTLTVHATDLFRPRPALHEVLAHAAGIAAISEYNARIVEALLRGRDASPVPLRIVHCGPDRTVWSPLPLPHGPMRALFIGRPVPKKGLDTLLEAWVALERPSARLDLLTELRPGAALPPGARILGLRAPGDVRGAMADANVFVLPCQRAPDGDMDGIPVSLMEAMAMGRPVITTPVSGIPELVADEPDNPQPGPSAVGWLVPPGDAGALAAALREAADHPELRERRGARGPTRVWERRFTLEDQVNGVLGLWGAA